MSRLGKKPLSIPDKVKIEYRDSMLKITGALGTIAQNIPECIHVKLEDNKVFLIVTENTRENDMLYGLTRGLVKNNLEGVTTGFKKELEMSGLGYKAAVEGKKINLQLGYSHIIHFPIPEGIKVEVEKQTRITVTGINKILVGDVAARIRSYRLPEPYKATGIKYVGEHIIRKAGKAAAGAAGGK